MSTLMVTNISDVFFIHIWWIPLYMKLRGSLMYLVITRTADTTCSKDMFLFSLWQLVFRLVPHSFSPNKVHSTQGRSLLRDRRSIFWGSLSLEEFLLCSWGLSSVVSDYYVFGCMLYFELRSLSQVLLCFIPCGFQGQNIVSIISMLGCSFSDPTIYYTTYNIWIILLPLKTIR